MSDFVILTDSSADLGPDLIDQYGIQVLPLSFTIRGLTYQDFPDHRDMDPRVFYDLLRKEEVATTAAVNVAQYIQALEPLLQEGHDVLILAFSSGLSMTYNASTMAVEELRDKYPDRKLYTVDTLCASLGQGLLVWMAAREREKGKSIEEVRDWVVSHKLNICHQFTVDDLHFLKRGGRISATTAVVGSMLQIKPVLHVDDEGHLIPGPARLSEGPGGPDGTDRHRPQGTDRVYQPRGLPRGRGAGGPDGQGPLRRSERVYQLCGPRHRRPLRSRHPGSVLLRN